MQLATRIGTMAANGSSMYRDVFNALCDGSLTGEYTFPDIELLRQNSFSNLNNWLSLTFPNVLSVSGGSSSSAFYNSKGLVKINMPKLKSIDYCLFEYCTALEEAYFDAATVIGDIPFARVRVLRKIYIPNVDKANSSRTWGFIEGLPESGLDVYNTNFSCSHILSRPNFLNMGNTSIDFWPHIRFHGNDGYITYDTASGSWVAVSQNGVGV